LTELLDNIAYSCTRFPDEPSGPGFDSSVVKLRYAEKPCHQVKFSIRFSLGLYGQRDLRKSGHRFIGPDAWSIVPKAGIGCLVGLADAFFINS
jgi:hypothetical protein